MSKSTNLKSRFDFKRKTGWSFQPQLHRLSKLSSSSRLQMTNISQRPDWKIFSRLQHIVHQYIVKALNFCILWVYLLSLVVCLLFCIYGTRVAQPTGSRAWTIKIFEYKGWLEKPRGVEFVKEIQRKLLLEGEKVSQEWLRNFTTSRLSC